MVAYLTKFAPNPKYSSSIERYVKERLGIRLGRMLSNIFSESQRRLTESPVLAYFEPDKQITLQVDANVAKVIGYDERSDYGTG